MCRSFFFLLSVCFFCFFVSSLFACRLIDWLIHSLIDQLILWFFVHLLVCLCDRVIACLFVRLFVDSIICIFVCLSVCQSVGLSVCLNACIHEQSCSKHTRYKGGKLVKYRSKISNTPPLWLFFAMGWSNPDPLTHQAGHGRDGTALLVELGFARLGKTQGCYPIRSKNGEILWVCGKIGVK